MKTKILWVIVTAIFIGSLIGLYREYKFQLNRANTNYQSAATYKSWYEEWYEHAQHMLDEYPEIKLLNRQYSPASTTYIGFEIGCKPQYDSTDNEVDIYEIKCQ